MKRLLFVLALAATSLLFLIPGSKESVEKPESLSQDLPSDITDLPYVGDFESEPTSMRWVSFSSETLPILNPPSFALPEQLADSLQCDLPLLESPQTLGSFQFKEVKNVNPPFPTIQVPHEVITVSAADLKYVQKLKFMDGTVLNIPANALCMKDGSDVKDPIQVAYMPLDNAFDVMLSGIPMTYDSAGGQSLFQTAGMFRLEAKTNKGEEVVLKDGKAMNIAMPTVDTGGRYNDYRFDEQSGIWKFQETSVSAYNSFVRVENSKESESLDYLFFNKDYAYTYSTENRLTPTNLCVNHSRKHNSCRIHEPYNIKPSRIKTIYFKTQTVRNAEDKTKSIYFTAEKPDYYWAFNPEWRVFNNWKFKSIDYTESKEFRLAYKGGKRYNDMRLIWDGKSNDVLLLLKHGGGMDSLHAEAWDLNDRKAFQLRRTFARKYRRYQRELNKREECHRANMRRFQTQTDRMKLVQTRPMVLPGFGIYNCDRTYLMASPRRYTKLEYTTAEGLLIMPSQIIVLDEKARGAFFLNSMSFNACTKGTVAVLTSDTSGNMLACSGKHLAQYGSYKGGKRLSFQVVPDEVKEYTALQNWLESLSEE